MRFTVNDLINEIDDYVREQSESGSIHFLHTEKINRWIYTIGDNDPYKKNLIPIINRLFHHISNIYSLTNSFDSYSLQKKCGYNPYPNYPVVHNHLETFFWSIIGYLEDQYGRNDKDIANIYDTANRLNL